MLVRDLCHVVGEVFIESDWKKMGLSKGTALPEKECERFPSVCLLRSLIERKIIPADKIKKIIP
jgi:hypothetical protein